MQTKQQIQQLLAETGAFPNKRLGQHFLIDLNLMRLLVETAQIDNNDVVLEVGCGTGSLTEALSQRAGKVIAVEIDRMLCTIARNQLAEAGNVEIINTDILIKKSTLCTAVTKAIELARKEYTGRLLLVANLPYSVASPVVLNLAIGPIVAEAMCVTVQKQVAERMTAEPGCSEYGTLSILLAATGDAKTIRVLRPTVFWPQPQVDSAMVKFVRQSQNGRVGFSPPISEWWGKPHPTQIKNMQLFTEIVSLFMRHRRKMLKACSRLAPGRLGQVADWPTIFEQCSIDPTKRPQQLSVEDYIAIANTCDAAERSD
jgi:16S rRNA (adenine1518-N6/adenine1519-N6)-dimethyltransferase